MDPSSRTTQTSAWPPRCKEMGILCAFDRERVDAHLASGELVSVLEKWTITQPELYLYYPSRRHLPVTLRAFIDCLLDNDLSGKPRRRGSAKKDGGNWRKT